MILVTAQLMSWAGKSNASMFRRGRTITSSEHCRAVHTVQAREKQMGDIV
ncbi:hypothetical protein ACPV4J_21915 [Photobacterium swingsii]